jgi:hypothetical protein
MGASQRLIFPFFRIDFHGQIRGGSAATASSDPAIFRCTHRDFDKNLPKSQKI